MKFPHWIKRNIFVALLFCLAMLGPTQARATLAKSALGGSGEDAGLSPFLDWKTLETPHFRITYPHEMSEIAQKCGRFYEEAHQLLSPRLHWESRFRVQIVITDNTDMANGLTTPIGRIGMILMVTPPENFFSTAYYDDWLRLLVFHEYTHHLNMDATSSFWIPLRYVFGDVLLPNSLWAPWMLEGMAVYYETRFTKSGRGRSPYYSMVVRAQVERNELDTPSGLTLDRVNGTYPYFPGGETAYLFGYELTQQLAEQPIKKGKTFDRRTPIKNSEDYLGLESQRSSRRVPFFINGNVKNLTGKSWSDLWDEWVTQANIRANAELDKIKEEPLTPTHIITPDTYEVMGSSVSPDGKWIATTQNSLDRRMGLVLYELPNEFNAKTPPLVAKRVEDKLLGSTLSFSPDSKLLFYSSIQRSGAYNLFSDLSVYNLDHHCSHRLTHALRARDPSLSPDGKTLVFTLTQGSTTGLAQASLLEKNGQVELGPVKTLYFPNPYDRISTPHFSPDGKWVVYSIHKNGFPSEDIERLDIATRKAGPVVSDGATNRFPSFGPGALYFVSDKTGVDNIYRLKLDPLMTLENTKPERITNVTTGVSFPSVSQATMAAPQGRLFAAVFEASGKASGFKLAELEFPAKPYSDKRAVELRAASQDPKELGANTPSETYPTGNYSVWPSILPREWAPILVLGPHSSYLGAQILGFDALDVHRYLGFAAYDTQVKIADWIAQYSNRSLGATLSVAASEETEGTSSSGNTVYMYDRKRSFSFSASYPFTWTYSSLTPTFSLNTERTTTVAPGTSPETDDVIYKSRDVPSADGSLSFSNLEGSPLGIMSERGFTTTAATRMYSDSGVQSWKGLFVVAKPLSLGNHHVLVPNFKASMVSKRTDYHSTSVLLEGKASRILNPFSGDSLDQLTIRGYPGTTISARSAAVTSLDYVFPLWYIYRGFGTFPFYFTTLTGSSFAEAAVLPGAQRLPPILPSAGVGIKLSSLIFYHVPVVFK
ncbi:hypothetical protein WDW86_03215, partial [Bdellovibrionota bacterium FG-2]